MSVGRLSASASAFAPIPVETMRTLLVCRGPIAFETLEVYRRCQWQLPHVIISSKEWIAELQRTAPWIVDLPSSHVHYIQEYNDIDAVLEIAAANRIDAIYPGYGFLAESADFADRVQAAGMRFIGPTPNALRAVGDKDAAIALAKQLGIPTIPGDDALVTYAQTHRQLDIEAEAVRRTLAMAQAYPGYPLRLKHPAGGGGKGQRVLSPEEMQGPHAQEAIVEALTKLWAEMGVSAADADARKGVLLELNIPRPLHWEVQLFGDGETVVHLAARDCSFQNPGYQKFIELALHPDAIESEIQALIKTSTNATRMEALRQRKMTLERICEQALRLGQAIDLRGAATVEFLIDEQGEAFFLEVNPRIQVEHAVTEGVARVRGELISLVEWQQRVAAGEKLHFRQSDITCVGDAIEVRLNAWHEDLNPVLGGVVQTLRFHVEPWPELQNRLRVEASGLMQRRNPWTVPSYDANFALIIVSGASRHQTLDDMLTTLQQVLHIEGNAELNTNLQPVIGMLTLMRALPPETEFRTDTSSLWMAMIAVITTQKDNVLSYMPAFPRKPAPYDAARLARLIQHTVEAGLAHPSRLLTYYLNRLTRLREPGARPLADLEVLWQLAEALRVPMYDEEQRLGEALVDAANALWLALDQSPEPYTACCRLSVDTLTDDAALKELVEHVAIADLDISQPETFVLFRDLLGWLNARVPVIRRLIQVLEQTQIHTLLTPNADLTLAYPHYLTEAKTLADLHGLLSSALRPTMLRHGELLSPMEATIYHQSEPGAPPFVEVGGEIRVGQTIALLEAMKMFSELPSPVDGVVEAILVESGQGVKTGTPLFKIVTQDVTAESTIDCLPYLEFNVFQNDFLLL